MRQISKQSQRELTQEEKFEFMIEKWKKQANDKLKDIKKGKERKRPDTRYCLSPFRIERGA